MQELTDHLAAKRYNAAMLINLRSVLLTLCLAAVATHAYAADKQPSLRVESDQPVLTQNLQASLDVLHESCSADRSRKRLLERNLQRRAALAAQAVGYYEADISIRFEDRKNCWRALVSAKAGRPVKIMAVQIRIEGDAETDPAFAELISNSPLKIDAILRHSDYQTVKDGL
ncbi:MAG: POTRA domain-containing protein, partial [Alcanivoracaceae bacterium]|nr:POTRA domain-containing protein [Alcanivoracaceae bacterium]